MTDEKNTRREFLKTTSAAVAAASLSSAGAMNFVFGDGSLRAISYGIQDAVHQRLANREDGQPVDASQF